MARQTKREKLCCDLLDSLTQLELRVVSVGHDGGKGRIKLFVYIERKKDLPQIPTEFQGYPVKAKAVGRLTKATNLPHLEWFTAIRTKVQHT